MKNHISYPWLWLLGVVISSVYMCKINSARAQITPDATLPQNSNVLQDGKTFNITGGTQAGTNLFHSFSEFSIPTGTEAVFNNGADIQNIISRVTGNSISNIDGLIQTQGTANLFVINPNGIIFGENARLDIGGSFIASTASAVKFADGSQFNTNNKQAASLLSINVPMGLQYGTNPGSIQVKGDGQGFRMTSQLIDTETGLRVKPNQTLALVGGDIFLEGATIKTAGGRIELGSVGENSLVSLTSINKGFSLGYEGVSNYKNISLSQIATVDASGAGGGDIQVQGQHLTLSGGSTIEVSTLLADKGGNLTVNTTESIEILGIDDYDYLTGLFAHAYPGATGDAGELTINTKHLLVRDGGMINTGTYGPGKGGKLTVNTTETVEVTGISLYSSSILFAGGAPGSTGDGGELTINTKQLLVRDGGQVASVTLGSGKAADLSINADSVEIIGKWKLIGDRIYSSGLFASSQRGATGDAGNLTINTEQLLVRDVGIITAGTQSKGKGGNLTINAKHLLILNGSLVNSSTSNAGNAGNLTINANSVQVKGKSTDGQLSSRLFATSGIGLLTNYPNTTGDGGNIRINTGELLVQDSAGILVGAAGKGNAGNLEINARSIRLDNNASLDATTASSSADNSQQQATITLSSRDLFLVRGSRITTNATGSNVTGGNINIDTDVLAAAENSDISANSTDFQGGRVTINTQAIFATEDSDITATGANPQLSGTVQINTPNVDPSQGLTPLPETVIDPAGIMAQNPCQNSIGSTFVVTGRGGLPINPSQPLTPLGVRVGLVEPTSTLTTGAQSTNTSSVSNQTQTPTQEQGKTTNSIVEAQGLVINEKGEIVLTAENTISTNYQNGWRSPTGCSAS